MVDCVWQGYPALNWDDNFKTWLDHFPALYKRNEFNQNAPIQDPIRYSIHYRGVAQVHRYHSTQSGAVKAEAEYKFKNILKSAGIKDCDGNQVLETIWQKALVYRNGYTQEGSTVVRW